GQRGGIAVITPAASSFDRWASEYDAYRPGYPDLLFDLIEERLGLPAQPRVADIGAGTGLATFAMARRGWRVTAVEPGRRMVEVLRRRIEAGGGEAGGIDAVEASAEETGLPSAAFDLAV